MARRSTTTIVPPPGARSAHPRPGLLQPDERDASPADAARAEELAPAQHDVMAQAGRDVASGQQDTDCRSDPRAADSACPPGPAADRSDDAPAPGDTLRPDVEERRGVRHDPGWPAPAPDGSPAR